MTPDNRPTISLCYTSVRPAEIGKVVSLWTTRSVGAAKLQWVMSHDAGDNKTKKAMEDVAGCLNPSISVGIVENKTAPDCVAGWNAAAEVSTGDIIIAVADDFEPGPEWDRKLLSVAEPGWWLQSRVVATNDLYNPDIFTLAILTRARYNEFGYLFYPSYQSLFSDTEFTSIAIADEVVIDARWLVFEHLHPDCKKRVRDESDLKHASKARWNRGELLYEYRKAVGFPTDRGPVADKRAGSSVKYAVVIQAIQDDFCLFETVKRLLDEGRKLDHGDSIGKVFLFRPDKCWDGQLANPVRRDEVLVVAAQLNQVYPGMTEVVDVLVDKVSHWNQPRIRVETDCRNFYSHYCRRLGYEHLLIVDGDEFWRNGLMNRLGNFLRDRGWPKSVFTGMVPVAGLPGYPIEGALDKACIYARSDTFFKECRGAVGFRHHLPGYDIYHFTATRRTLKEIADKHLGSGHAGQPGYYMQEWVDRVLLPGLIKPGLRNCHMYSMFNQDNVWPLVRAWSSAELGEIPESVKAYIAK